MYDPMKAILEVACNLTKRSETANNITRQAQPGIDRTYRLKIG